LVPPDKQTVAYDDIALSIGFGQTIFQPSMAAKLTEALGLNSTERVLEVSDD
jgi:protein-L-isoaspartate O-methyltransferase